MSLKQFLKHSLLCSILLIIFLLTPKSLRVLSAIICTIYFKLRSRDHTFIYLIVLFFIVSIPRYQMTYSNWNEGRVDKVSTNYVIVRNGREKIMLYTQAQPTYDSIIKFDGEPEELESKLGFYAFQFEEWAKSNHISVSITPNIIQQTKQSYSVRGLLQRKIISIQDETWRNILLQVLLGIRPQEQVFQSFLNDSGFSLLGVIYLISLITKYFMSEKSREYLILIISLILCIIYHFPYVLLQRCIFQILKNTTLHRNQIIGVGYLIGLLIEPNCVSSISFLLPACFRYSSCLLEGNKYKTYLISCMIQSIVFHHVNPLQMLCYKYIIPFLGFYWCIGLVAFLFHINATTLFILFDRILSFLQYFDLKGSMIGFGCIFYFGMIFFSRKMKHADYYHIVIFFVFLLTGLFHPLASITFINVGQGDAILIRTPLNQGNILIDTGKPSQYNSITTLFDALSIHQIQTLIVTHPDLDHNGNQVEIMNSYHVENLITNHFVSEECNGILFYDLNKIQNEDENQSSLVLYFQMNGLTYLLMGDADTHTEEEIIHQFGNFEVNILKNGHHGSKTSSSEDFLDTIQPDICIISSGKYEIYHHPSPVVIERLQKRFIPYFDTKTEGDITILCFMKWNIFITSTGKISFIFS